MAYDLSLRCGEDRHVLRVGRRGAVAMLDHDQATLDMFAALGGREAGCAYWRQRLGDPDFLADPSSVVPAALGPLFRGASARHERRVGAARAAPPDPLDPGLHPTELALFGRTQARLQATAMEAFRPALGRWRYMVTPGPARVPAAAVYADGLLQIDLPARWWQVYYRGLAVVDGCAVLALLHRPKGRAERGPAAAEGWRVVACRVGRAGRRLVVRDWAATIRGGGLHWDQGWEED